MPPVRERYSYKIFKISSLCIVPTLSENRAQTSLAYLVTFYRYLFCILGNDLWGKCRFEQMVVIISPMLMLNGLPLITIQNREVSSKYKPSSVYPGYFHSVWFFG